MNTKKTIKLNPTDFEKYVVKENLIVLDKDAVNQFGLNLRKAVDGTIKATQEDIQRAQEDLKKLVHVQVNRGDRDVDFWVKKK